MKTEIIHTAEEEKIWRILETVCDPEIPVLSILDLGIVRAVKILQPELSSVVGSADKTCIEITITPTYSGCPAMDMIAMHIKLCMAEHGFKNIRINSVLSPAWSTDWMTESGKIKLKQYGIAPPVTRSTDPDLAVYVECPQCHSHNTRLISEFGSTACKSLYKCNDCQEPFDHFKCH